MSGAGDAPRHHPLPRAAIQPNDRTLLSMVRKPQGAKVVCSSFILGRRNARTMALPWSVGRPRVAFGTTVSPKHSALRTPLSGAVKELGEPRLLRDTGRACLIRLYAAA